MKSVFQKLLANAVAVALAGPVGAQPNPWIGVDSGWLNPANWALGVPGHGQDVLLMGPQTPGSVWTANYATGVAPPVQPFNSVVVGTPGLPGASWMTLDHTGPNGGPPPNLLWTIDLSVGVVGKAEYKIAGVDNQLLVERTAIVGGSFGGNADADGVFSHGADATVQVRGDLLIGLTASSAGKYALDATGGAVGSTQLTVDGSATVGKSGAGTLYIGLGARAELTGTTGMLLLGQDAGSQGTVIVEDGQLNLSGANSYVGVGDAGAGSLRVISGGQVTAAAMGIGTQTTGVGTVEVGSVIGQSQLTLTSGHLGVGVNGTGVSTLTVNAGGTVQLNGADAGVFVGGNAGSQGRIVVDGGQLNLAGATSFLGVGQGGQGELDIKWGGHVQVGGNMDIGSQPTGVGNVTVAANGQLTLANGLNVGQFGTGALNVDYGGAVTLTADAAWMGVGNSSGKSGSVTVKPGGTLQLTGANAGLGVGNAVGATGTIAIDGGQMTLSGQNSGLYIGTAGTGTLSILNGGQVTTSNMGLGNQPGGLGTVEVGNGSGQSMLTTTNGIVVGWASAGDNKLTVNAGGMFAATGANAAVMAGGQQNSRGAIVIDGGQLNLSGANSYVGVGDAGAGSLRVISGGQVTAAAMGIGTQTTGVGTVEVGSVIGQSQLTLTSGHLGVGVNGTGVSTLTVNAGGTVQLNGADAGVFVGGNAGSQGRIVVDGGQLNLAGATSFLGVGQNGTGGMAIRNGGQVQVGGKMDIGGQGAGVGNVSVATNGQLTVANGLNVGQFGNGTLSIASGGAVTLTAGNAWMGVGNSIGKSGTVTIDAGGVLQLSGANAGLGVGNNGGTGTLNVAGGALESANVYVGANGTVNYSGGTITLGGGAGTLANGGTVNVTGGGSLVVAGNVDNAGLFKITGTTITYTGTFTNSGTYNSDPSTNIFASDLVVSGSGYLLGGVGDVFQVGGSFLNSSTNAAQWDTDAATLIFAGGGTHLFGVASDGSPAFAWGDVRTGNGDLISFFDSTPGTPGMTLYVGILDLFDQRLDAIIVPDGLLTIYYDATKAANDYLKNATHLPQGLTLIPYTPTPGTAPEPGTLALLVLGLAGLATALRRRH